MSQISLWYVSLYLVCFSLFLSSFTDCEILAGIKDEPSYAGWLEENFHINFMSRWVRQMQAPRENKPSEIFSFWPLNFPLNLRPPEGVQRTICVCLPDRTFMIIPFLIKEAERAWMEISLPGKIFRGASKDPRMKMSFAGRLTRSKNIERKDWISRTISN